MPFSATAVANEFLNLGYRDGEKITPLKMQKLVYFAHGWHLAVTGLPLLREEIQAWQFGPVIQSLYKEFREYGSGPIGFPALVLIQGGQTPASLDREGSPEEVATAKRIIERVWHQYGKFSAAALTTLTHGKDTPWSMTPHKEEPETVIPNRLIQEYFVQQASKTDGH